MEFKIDKQKALDLAQEMGLNVTFNAEVPGVTCESASRIEHKKFEDFFPELENGIDSKLFVTKESSDLPSVSKSISIVLTGKADSKILVNSMEMDFNTDSQSKWAKAS